MAGGERALLRVLWATEMRAVIRKQENVVHLSFPWESSPENPWEGTPAGSRMCRRVEETQMATRKEHIDAATSESPPRFSNPKSSSLTGLRPGRTLKAGSLYISFTLLPHEPTDANGPLPAQGRFKLVTSNCNSPAQVAL